MKYRHSSHTVLKIEYHFVWITKYRYEVLEGDIGHRLVEFDRQTCDMFDIAIKKGVVSMDHVHIMISALPNMAPSEIMRRIKGGSTTILFDEFPSLKKQ